MHWPNVGLLLGQRRRRWTSIKPTLGQCILFAGYRHRGLERRAINHCNLCLSKESPWAWLGNIVRILHVLKTSLNANPTLKALLRYDWRYHWLLCGTKENIIWFYFPWWDRTKQWLSLSTLIFTLTLSARGPALYIKESDVHVDIRFWRLKSISALKKKIFRMAVEQ